MTEPARPSAADVDPPGLEPFDAGAHRDQGHRGCVGRAEHPKRLLLWARR